MTTTASSSFRYSADYEGPSRGVEVPLRPGGRFWRRVSDLGHPSRLPAPARRRKAAMQRRQRTPIRQFWRSHHGQETVLHGAAGLDNKLFHVVGSVLNTSLTLGADASACPPMTTSVPC